MIIILATKGKNNEIGKNNELIWKLKYDLKLFKEKTEGNVMVMGKNTFNLLSDVLPNRKYIVLSTTKKFNKPIGTDVMSIDNVMELIKKCRELSKKKDVYIIGGESIFKLFLDYAQKMYITQIDAIDFEADAYFPVIEEKEWNIKVLEKNKEKNINFSFVEYLRKL